MEDVLDGHIFSVDWRGPLDEMMSVPGRTYFAHHMSQGAIGCVLSHLSVLQDAIDSGYKTIWVMEDDVEVVQDPRTLSGLIAALDGSGKEKWDILFTDQDTVQNTTGQHIPCRQIC